MKHILLLLLLSMLVNTLPAQQLTKQQYREDLEYLWSTVKQQYSYWEKKKTDWDKVRTVYGNMVDTVSSKQSFVLLLEKVLYELYDHHASLSTNTMESQRMVPSGTDIWAVYINGKPMITAIRNGSGAEKAGMIAGMELVAYNEVDIEKAIQPFLPKTLLQPDIEARNYALRVLLAGKHSENRKITISLQNKREHFYPDRPVNLLEQHNYTGKLIAKTFPGKIGYIRINDRLWDNDIIQLFDSTLATLANTTAMILDLRETPSGGNSTVARAIMGRFILKEGFYQKHAFTAEAKEFGVQRSWMEIVSPRKPAYAKPLLVLVDHWTGSMGEGMTIGFDALKRATIVGTAMAGLNGAVYSFSMPNSGIGFSFPAEKLFHVNGTARENFKPAVLVNLNGQKLGEDRILEKGLSIIRKQLKK